MNGEVQSLLSGYWLQVGFVEGVINEEAPFRSLQSALSYVFSHSRECAVLLCRGIPVCISYKDDMPTCLPCLVEHLDIIQKNRRLSDHKMRWKSKNIEAEWCFNIRDDQLWADVKWLRVRGGYQQALNAFNTAFIEKDTFVNEWLMLLRQCQRCLSDANATLVGNAQLQEQLLNKVESRMTRLGRFYQHLNTCVIRK